jgi:hypothetical protein
MVVFLDPSHMGSHIDPVLFHGVPGPHVSLLFGADLSGAAVDASGAGTWEQNLERPNTHRLGQS